MKKVLFTVLALAALVLVSCSEKKSTENNPFMSEYENEYGIPPFDKITYADYEPAVDAGIEQQNAEIDSIIKNTAEPNFEHHPGSGQQRPHPGQGVESVQRTEQQRQYPRDAEAL